MAVGVEEVRAFAADFPRSSEVVVHGRLKFRVGQIVWLAFSREEDAMGFAFPKEHREALVESDPATFFYPRASDMRFNWACARLAALEPDEMRELVWDAWCHVVPQKVVRAFEATRPDGWPG